jgi:hypothetical protein
LRSDLKKIKLAILETYGIEKWIDPLAVTLTLKIAIPSHSGWVRGDQHRYSQNLKHTLNMLHHQLFGSRWRWKSTRLKSFPVLEQDCSGRSHYHLAMDCPRRVSPETFAAMVAQAWVQSHWGHRQVDVRPADADWLGYMLKSRDFCAAIDWDNFHY